MTDSAKARAIGLNHIALEVADIDEALAKRDWQGAVGIRWRGPPEAQLA
jgi:hypothetical protein